MPPVINGALLSAQNLRLFKLCFQSNKMLDTVNKICGEQRKNRPDLMVRSLNGKASQEEINFEWKIYS